MKKLIVVLLFLAFAQGATAQRAQSPLANSVLQLGEIPELPAMEFDMAAVVDLLSEYDIVHESRVMNYLQNWGLTDPETRTIYINPTGDLNNTRITVVHELLHAAYMRRGMRTGGPVWEPLIEGRAEEIVKKLYGFNNVA